MYSEDTDQSAHLRGAYWSESLLSAPSECSALLSYCAFARFVLHSYILYYAMTLSADSEDPDETARMRRLIWALLPAYFRRHVLAFHGPTDLESLTVTKI